MDEIDKKWIEVDDRLILSIGPKPKFERIGKLVVENKKRLKSTVKSVLFRSGDIVDIIVNGVHIGGKGGGLSKELVFEKDEYISHLQAEYCLYFGYGVIGTIFLKTNKNRYLRAGIGEGAIMCFTLEKYNFEGKINIVGGVGRVGYLQSLAVLVEPKPEKDMSRPDLTERIKFVATKMHSDEWISIPEVTRLTDLIGMDSWYLCLFVTRMYAKEDKENDRSKGGDSETI